MFQAFWMGTPSWVSRRAAPGLETWTTLNGPSHMGESLCSPSLERTCLRTRSPTSSVLERTLCNTPDVTYHICIPTLAIFGSKL